MWDECVEPTPDPLAGVAACLEGYSPMTLYCSDYQDDWVFNIGDFVPTLWDTGNNGVKLLQVGFYPN